MQATTVREALRVSLAGALGTFLSALPRIIASAIVLLVGWLLASLVARGTLALLRAVRFNDLAHRSGLAGVVQAVGVRQDAAGVIAEVVKWFVRLVTLVVAFDTLGLPAVSLLGVATALINTLLVGVVGAVALAAGLAFGLGGRDRAAQLLSRLDPPGGGGPDPWRGPAAVAATPVRVSGPPRAVAFEEGWTTRSGIDRRRIARPGPDRRVAVP